MEPSPQRCRGRREGTGVWWQQSCRVWCTASGTYVLEPKRAGRGEPGGPCCRRDRCRQGADRALPGPGSRVLSLEALAGHGKDQVVLSAPGRGPDNSGGFCPLPMKTPSPTGFLLQIPPGLPTLAVLPGESPSEIGVLGHGACSGKTRSERGAGGYLGAVASPAVVLPHTRFGNVGRALRVCTALLKDSAWQRAPLCPRAVPGQGGHSPGLGSQAAVGPGALPGPVSYPPKGRRKTRWAGVALARGTVLWRVCFSAWSSTSHVWSTCGAGRFALYPGVVFPGGCESLRTHRTDYDRRSWRPAGECHPGNGPSPLFRAGFLLCLLRSHPESSLTF